MDSTVNDPLAALRGLHPPEPVGWWPLAPGWWLLIALLLLLAIWLGRKTWQAARRRQQQAKQQQWLLAELAHIEQLAQSQPRTALMQLSQLLRRCALQMREPQEVPVAGLHGEHWLSWLQNNGGEALNQHRHWLLEQPYRADNQAPPAELFDDSRQFLRSASKRLAGLERRPHGNA